MFRAVTDLPRTGNRSPSEDDMTPPNTFDSSRL
jgi:hypothetical protein